MVDYTNKLKRDYNKDPLKYGELIPYEDLYFLYITCNLGVNEVAKYFNNVKPCTIRKSIKKHNIVKSEELKLEVRKRTNKKKFGTEFASQNEQCKQKSIDTCLERYGVESANRLEEKKQKVKDTCLKKYGTTTASQSQVIKNKTKQTCEKKYGYSSYMQTEEFKTKTKQTNLEKYGTPYPSQSKIFQDKIKSTSLEKYKCSHFLSDKNIIEKRKQTCLKLWGTNNISTKHISQETLNLINDKEQLLEYINQFEVKDYKQIASTLGISYEGLKKKLQKFDLWNSLEHNVCNAENELKKLFPDFYKTKKIIPPLEIDLYNEKLKLGIEYNGIYWHSELFKHKKYHQEKSLKAKENKVFLFHIFEHEWIDDRKRPIIISMINNLLGTNNRLMARKCKIKEIDYKTCSNFLQENHLQGKDQSSIRLGLFYEENLVSVMTFCKPRFNKNYEWELSRFCNSLNTTVIGGASKLFKFFLKNYNPKNIISYSNFSKTRGIIYNKLGFTQIKLTSPNYIWFKGLETLSRYQCQKHLLKQYKYLGNTEEEIMHNRGFNKIYDCGNYVWDWTSDSVSS